MEHRTPAHRLHGGLRSGRVERESTDDFINRTKEVLRIETSPHALNDESLEGPVLNVIGNEGKTHPRGCPSPRPLRRISVGFLKIAPQHQHCPRMITILYLIDLRADRIEVLREVLERVLWE